MLQLAVVITNIDLT